MPCGCCDVLSIGGPWCVVPLVVYGLPRAMLQVSHGGAKRVTVMCCDRICVSQNCIVEGKSRSLWGIDELDKSIESGNSV